MTKVKICGIRRLEDAIVAADSGADALGFVFFRKSPRYIEPEAAAAIINKLPPFVTPVALFVNEEKSKIWDVLNTTGINVLQFHGDETPGFAASFEQRVVKAIRVKDAGSIETASGFDVNAFLLDAWSPDLYGGTGKKFDWDMLRQAESMKRFILAGGLTPENVALAVNMVKPYGVDVSSGVESAPGVKDHGKVKRFIENAKRAS